MKAVLIALLITACLFFTFYCFFIYPKKCSDCKKHSLYCYYSHLEKKETKYKDVRKENKYKDKNGVEVTEIHIEHNVPYTVETYKNIYKCNNCGNTISNTSSFENRFYENFDDYKSHLKRKYIRNSIIFSLLILPLIIGITKIEIDNRVNSDDAKLQRYISDHSDNNSYLSDNNSHNNGFCKVNLSYSKNGFKVKENYHYKIELIDYETKKFEKLPVYVVSYFTLSKNLESKYSLFNDLIIFVNIKFDETSNITSVVYNCKVTSPFNINSKSDLIKSDKYDAKYDQYLNDALKLQTTLTNFCLDEIYCACEIAGFDIYD